MLQLIRGRESMYRRNTPRKGLVQDATGSVTLTVEEESPRETASPGQGMCALVNIIDLVSEIKVIFTVPRYLKFRWEMIS